MPIYSRPGGRYDRLLSVGGFLSWQTAPRCPYPTAGFRWHRFERDAFYWEPPKTVAEDGRAWSATSFAGEQPLVAEGEFAVPYAVLVGVTGGPILIGLGRWAARAYGRRKRSASGLCPACGYDLRATPGRCPECGIIPPTHEKPAGYAGGAKGTD